MKNKKLLSVLILVTFISITLTFLPSCNKEEQQIQGKKIIKLGAILPLTGDAATYGKNCQKGMIVASIIYGIDITFEDSALDPKKAINALNKLVNINKVDAVLGDMFSSTTLAFAPQAERKNIIVLSPTAGSEEVPKTGKFIFSLYPSAFVEGAYMADKLIEMKEDFAVGIIHTQEQVYTDIAKGFVDELKSKIKKDVVFVEAIQPNLRVYKDIISKYMKTTDVDTVYLSGDKIMVCNFIKQSKQMEWSVSFFSQSTLYDQSLIDQFGAYLGDVIFTGPYFDVNNKDEITKKFIMNFKDQFKNDPDVWAAYGFDSVLTVYEAFTKCGNCDNLKISDTLRNLNIIGTTGQIRFNQYGGAIRTFKLFSFKDGKIAETY